MDSKKKSKSLKDKLKTKEEQFDDDVKPEQLVINRHLGYKRSYLRERSSYLAWWIVLVLVVVVILFIIGCLMPAKPTMALSCFF